MIRFLSVSLLISLLSLNIYSQWTNQNVVPEGNHLWSTFFVSDNTGWMVGSEGFIKKTTNGGLDWMLQNSGTNTATLRSVFFNNENIGWVCGEDGLIITTSDGGQNWYQQTSGTSELLTDIQFIGQSTGFAVGFNGKIIKTTDGGFTWNTLNSGTNYNLYALDFIDGQLGFAVGDGRTFLKTSDGGMNWEIKNISFNGVPIINCVEFIDATTGWIGYGFDKHSADIKKTSDGGETWSSTLFSSVSKANSENHYQLDNPLDTQVGIRSIYFKDSNNGYAVGGTRDGWNRCVFSTTDGGNTWQSKYVYSEQTGLLSVFVNNQGMGWAVGYSGVIYLSNDGGDDWFQILSGNNNLYYSGDWITSIFMVNDSVGWAGGYRKGIWYYPILLKTTNGGKIWETNKEFSDFFIGTEANIYFLNENIGWVSFYDRASYKTTDGGENWVTSGNAGNQKYFINQDTGWGTYEPLGIFKSTDGGNNWVKKSSEGCRSLYFTDLFNGWAVGDSGAILKSSDEGENWYPQVSGSSVELNSVNFFDSNIGMCVGNSGTALLTINGGNTWTSQNIGTTDKLNSVVFTNSSTIWVVGNNGTLLNSTDLGITWVSSDELTQNNLVSAFFINETTGWVGGSVGTILKYQVDVVPVELISFTAEVNNNNIELNWQTATEVNNTGFDIERSTSDEKWVAIGFVNGYGNSVTPISYSYLDKNMIGGSKYRYRLKQIDLDGRFEYSNEIEIDITPDNFSLFQNFPNPFNPSTTIRYQIANESKVEIRIYDMLGSEVLTLLNENKQAGTYEVQLNAENLSSGTYVYRITADGFVESKKMILMK